MPCQVNDELRNLTKRTATCYNHGRWHTNAIEGGEVQAWLIHNFLRISFRDNCVSTCYNHGRWHTNAIEGGEVQAWLIHNYPGKKCEENCIPDRRNKTNSSR